MHVFTTLLSLGAAVGLLVLAGWWAVRLSHRSVADWLIWTFALFVASVILSGFLLSWAYLTSNVLAWAILPPIVLSVLGLSLRILFRKDAPRVQPFSLSYLLRERRRKAVRWWRNLTTYQRFVLATLSITLGFLGLINLLLVLFTVPNEWDSMTGHLNRVMQYVQRGTMRHFGGTNWNMDTYPKSVCTVQIWSFLMTGRTEAAFRFIHHLAYWMAAFTIGATAYRIAKNHVAAVLCALCYALLPDVLMQAITTETDVVLASYTSVVLYGLFSFRATQDNRYLYLTALAVGLAFGHKITFALVAPSVAVVGLYCLFWTTNVALLGKRVVRLGAALIVALSLWTLPTGYLKNIEVFDHPIGPPTALKHQSVERAGSLRNLLEQGSRNVVRYGYDHVNLDGIRNLPEGAAINSEMREPLVWLEDKLKMRLDEETDFSIIPFKFERRFWFYNANPYWGILGFGLLLPLVALTLLCITGTAAHRALALAVILHWLALSYSAPYDGFKGRYFISTALFATLLLTLLTTDRQAGILRSMKMLPGKIWLGIVVVLASLSAVGCVFFNIRALPFGWQGRPSVFKMDRVAQMTVGRPDIRVAYTRFDQLVPDTATVALGTINDDYEYPLYGPKLARRLIAINPFEQGLKPIPKEAQYLFFSKNVIRPKPGDIRLGTDTTMRDVVVPGEDYYLRKLK